MQIPDDRKRSWYEGYCEDSPCVLSEGPYHDRKDFLVRLKDRGLCGVEFVVSDDHARLKKALAEVLTDAAWQRCYVHFLRNALDDLPRRPMTTVFRSCAGCTTGGISRRPNET